MNTIIHKTAHTILNVTSFTRFTVKAVNFEDKVDVGGTAEERLAPYNRLETGKLFLFS